MLQANTPTHADARTSTDGRTRARARTQAPKKAGCATSSLSSSGGIVLRSHVTTSVTAHCATRGSVALHAAPAEPTEVGTRRSGDGRRVSGTERHSRRLSGNGRSGNASKRECGQRRAAPAGPSHRRPCSKFISMSTCRSTRVRTAGSTGVRTDRRTHAYERRERGPHDGESRVSVRISGASGELTSSFGTYLRG